MRFDLVAERLSGQVHVDGGGFLWPVVCHYRWDKETGEVRGGLHGVVQERLELVREVDVVNDHVVVAGLLDGAVEVWLPQAKPIAKPLSSCPSAPMEVDAREFAGNRSGNNVGCGNRAGFP